MKRLDLFRKIRSENVKKKYKKLGVEVVVTRSSSHLEVREVIVLACLNF